MNPVHYHIIFPPGTGGNHLANILSTDVIFAQRASEHLYDNLNKNAHPFKNGNDIDFASIDNKIFCSHLAQYIWNKHKINLSAKRKYLIIEISESCRNSVIEQRLYTLYPEYKNKYFFEEISTLYSVDTIKKLFNETDVTPLCANLIFNKDVNFLLKYLSLNYDLNLDTEKIKKMHSKWYSMIENTII